MKISKNILISTLTVMITLLIIMGTLIYAHQYTSSHAVQGNSFQNGKRMPQGEFQNKNNTKFQGDPSSGDIRKTKTKLEEIYVY